MGISQKKFRNNFLQDCQKKKTGVFLSGIFRDLNDFLVLHKLRDVAKKVNLILIM